jgi:hypothetical protein
MTGSSLEDRNPGISISNSRRSRNWISNTDNNNDVVSVRTQRSTNNYGGRTRLSILGNGNNLSSNESISPIVQMPQPDMSLDLIVRSHRNNFLLVAQILSVRTARVYVALCLGVLYNLA